MRYHILLNSKTPKGDRTEMVDVAAIGTRIPAGRRRFHLTEGGLEPYVLWIEKSADLSAVAGIIVVNWMSRHRKIKSEYSQG